MRVGVGVSAGSEVVCAALVTVDTDGSRAVEYRTVSADRQANTDMGDLVTSAIELMASLIPGHRSPDAIAVTYRTEEHAAGIRAALTHTTRDVRLVPESSAAVAHLATTGLIDGYDTIALVDLGASGMSVTVTDRTGGKVLAHDRSEEIGGDPLNALVKNLVQDMTRDNLRDDIRDDRGIGSARYRSIKEQLSYEDEVRIERYSGLPLTVTRDAFGTAAAPIFDTAAQFVRRVFDVSTHEPEAIVLIGGGAHIPLLATTLIDLFHAPVIRLPEPDAVLAVGAATIAASVVGRDYQLVTAGRDNTGRMGRYSGAIAAAVVAGGLVLAYGVQTIAPPDAPTISPAGSATAPAPESNDAGGRIAEGYPAEDISSTPTPTAGARAQPAPTDSTDTPGLLTASESPATTPTLRPAPDLPRIDWPMDPTSEPTSPQSTTDISVEPSPAVTTVEVPSTEPVEPSTPSGSTELTPGPTPRPSAEVSPEVTDAPTRPSAASTTDPSGSEATPELTAPPTVWSPPATTGDVSEQSAEPLSSAEASTPPTPGPAVAATPDFPAPLERQPST